MESGQEKGSAHRTAARWQWAAVGVGIATIALLLWTFVGTLDDHMSQSREMSRNAQWHVHAPVEGAQAAVLLQGGEP
ncbi:hypothetical protein [Comamonas terrigena]|uniref:hypothetical protein n=1 Tax=Comamonas terrigena TaxID=32013 RepID=UPI00244BC94A|nr:hypothetical protein [Comamonas terrigena]MDH1703468.1 hypothetical protein [Comamonas terrigena]